MPMYTQYEPWIEDTSWDFYSELLQHYKLIGGTQWSFFWQRQADADARARSSCGRRSVPPAQRRSICPRRRATAASCCYRSS